MEKQKRANEIGKRLRLFRGDVPRTVTARKMGISYSALCKFESGERIPSDEMKVLLADYYDTTVQSLFYEL